MAEIEVQTIATERADAILATHGESDEMLRNRVSLIGAAAHDLATETKTGVVKLASGATVYLAVIASASDPDADKVAGFGRASCENARTAYDIAHARFADKRADKSEEVSARILRLIHAGRKEATERYISEVVADCKTASQRAAALLKVEWKDARNRVQALQAEVKAENAARKVKSTGGTEPEPEPTTEPAVTGGESAPDAVLRLIREAHATLDRDGDTLAPDLLQEIATAAAALASAAADYAALVGALAAA